MLLGGIGADTVLAVGFFTTQDFLSVAHRVQFGASPPTLVQRGGTILGCRQFLS
jgi:hypothetical protein